MRGQMYKNISLLSLRYLLFLFLIISVLVKSISTVFVQISDTEYELLVNFEKSELTEKEAKSDFDEEQEEELIFYNRFIEIEIRINLIKGYFNIHKNILDFKPNIHLPPPRL